MKNKLSFGFLLAILLTFLSGCLGSSEPSEGNTSSSSEDEKVIRIASAETDDKAMDVLNEAGEEYEEEFGIKVEAEAVPLADIFTKINATHGTSAQYDAFLTGFIGHISILEEEGKLAPVDDIIESLGGEEDFYDGHILFPIDGETYWIPYDYNLAYGYVRKDWLEEKGLSVPTDWDEFINVAEELTNKEENQYGLMMPLKSDGATNWITSSLLWANDVRIFDDDWNVILDSDEMKPKVVESLELLKDLYSYMPAEAQSASYAEMTEAFISGQVGMTFYSGRLVDILERNNPELADDFEVFGIPKKDGDGIAATLGYDAMAVLESDHTEDTKDFVKWFYEEKLYDFMHTDGVHYFPAQESIYNDEEWRDDSIISKYWESGVEPQYELLQEADLHSIDTDGPETDARPGEIFESFLIPKLFQKVTINEEEPEQAVDDIAEEIRQLVNQ
ncbi:ABC transporter substrate-binding protein [Alteribacillus sp. YIM 98480]|uniref:ABC transporter substrate-binding protein n=1 Tax=Alteribacillus sp. YIM 98480 TaxID=2606599 RepID=UPI00131AF517|nr:extracellular solute-binding protein [Alteribacillus sp. YIM 98480]